MIMVLQLHHGKSIGSTRTRQLATVFIDFGCPGSHRSPDSGINLVAKARAGEAASKNPKLDNGASENGSENLETGHRADRRLLAGRASPECWSAVCTSAFVGKLSTGLVLYLKNARSKLNAIIL